MVIVYTRLYLEIWGGNECLCIVSACAFACQEDCKLFTLNNNNIACEWIPDFAHTHTHIERYNLQGKGQENDIQDRFPEYNNTNPYVSFRII